MGIARTSVLTGQVLGSLIQAFISVALVVAVALALGFHPTATPLEWLSAAGTFALVTLALTWLAVAFGLAARTPLAVAWCVGIIALAYMWARRLYNRNRIR